MPATVARRPAQLPQSTRLASPSQQPPAAEHLQSRPPRAESQAAPAPPVLHEPWAAPLASYLATLEGERSASPHTLRAYRRELRCFALFLQAQPELPGPEALRHTHVQHYLHQLYDRSLQRSSIARALAAIRSWCGFLAQQGTLTHNPATLVSTPRLPRRLPRVPTAEQLLAALDSPALLQVSAWPERDALILELLYGCGLRNAELASLDLTSIQAADELLRIRGKGRKERLTPYGQSVAQALAYYLPSRAQRLAEANAHAYLGTPAAQHPSKLSPPSEPATPSSPPVSLAALLTGRPGPLLLPVQIAPHARRAGSLPRLTTRSIGRILKALAIAGGLPAETHPHTLRHAFGTHLLADGADLRAIQELLGHARLSTTQRYTQLTNIEVAAVYDRTHPRAR